MSNTLVRMFCVGAVSAASLNASGAPVYLAQVSVVPSEGTAVFNGGTLSAIATNATGFLSSPIDHVSAPGIELTGQAVGEGAAAADVGTLRVSSRSAQSAEGGTTGLYSNDMRTDSRAQFMLDDVVISPTNAGNLQPFVNMTLRFAMSGLMPDPDAQGHVYDTALVTNFPSQAFGTVDDLLDLNVGLRDPSGTYVDSQGGFAHITASATNGAGSTAPTMVTSGALSNQAAALQGDIPFIAEVLFSGVPVGSPLELTVTLRSRAESFVGFPQNGGVWQGNGVVQFDHSLTFATDGVASLPDGFTLNSAGGRIVDNTWTPVPLPGSLLLLLTGFVIALGSRARAGAGLLLHSHRQRVVVIQP
jgi:hypothetical protein